MLFRKAAFILAVTLLLGTLGLAFWFWKPQNRLFSSPTLQRTNDSYLRAHAPAANLPPIPTNLYSLFQIERSSNRVQFSFPASSFPASEVNYVPLQFLHGDSNQSVPIGEGSIRLALVGMAFSQPRTNFDFGIQIPAKYYLPNAQPLDESETAPLEIVPVYQRSIDFHGTYPAAQFVFASSNISEFKILGFSPFDARTKYPLAGGYSSSTFTNGFYCSTSLNLWHQTPIELVVTVATGPVQTYTFPATEGSEIKYPGGQVRLLVKSENDLGSSSSLHDGRSNIVTLKIQPTFPTAPPRTSCSFVLHCWPHSHAIPVDFEFLDAAGNALRRMRSGTSGHLLTSVVEGRLEDVKDIRLRSYSKVSRLIFTIPELPGLPEQNRNIKNLFDVHIPYMYMRYEYDFQSGIAKLLQMNQQSLPLTFPNGYFPTFRSNTTTLDLFLEMESLLSDPQKILAADPRSNTIDARLHPFFAAVQKIRRTLGLNP